MPLLVLSELSNVQMPSRIPWCPYKEFEAPFYSSTASYLRVWSFNDLWEMHLNP